MQIVIDDISPQINYITTGQQPLGEKGTWDNGYKSQDPNYVKYYGETMSRTTGEGNQAVLVFNATSMKVFGSKWFNHCPYTVQIDEGPQQDQDGWVQNREYAAELASADNLDPSRSHSVTLTNHPSRNNRTTPDSKLGWFDVDYVLLTHNVDGQIRTSQLDDVAPSFTYEGSWTATSPAGFNNGTAHEASTVGSSATLFFTGFSVQVFGGLSSRHGEYSVLLDGVEASRRFNAVMHTDVVNVPLYKASGLAEGPHTLQIINRGVRGRDALISLDYAIVNTTLPEDAPLTAISSSSSALTSTGSVPGSSTGLPPLPSIAAPAPSSVNTYTLPGPSVGQTTSGPNTSGTGGGGGGHVDSAASEGGSSSSGTAPGVIAGIAVGGAVVIGLLLLAVWFLRRKLQNEERSASVWAASSDRNGGSYYAGGAPSHGSKMGYGFSSPGAGVGPGGMAGGRFGDGDSHLRPDHHHLANRVPLRVMNPSLSRGTSVGSRVSNFLGLGGSVSGGHGVGHGSRGGSEAGGYAWERDQERDGATERYRSYDPFNDMSEVNGPSAFVPRTRSPGAYAQAQYEKYGGQSPISGGGLERGPSLSHSAYSGYASERR